MATKTEVKETATSNESAFLALVQKQFPGAKIYNAESFGGGIPKLSKETLVGVPFVITEIKKHIGTRAQYFYFCHVLTQDGREGYFTDGGSGIPETLERFMEETNETGGLLCMNGLVRSEYDADPESGRPAGVTYYIG